MRRCFLLLVDGLRPDVAEAALANGRLPNLRELLAGGSVSRAVTVFPSTTSVAYLPFLTGCTPGRCNVPSIRWLDRTDYRGRWWRDREAVRSYCGYQSGRLDHDIAPDVRTIFQLVPESVGIYTMITRGLTPERDPSRRARQFWGAVAHYTEWHQPSDRSVTRHLLQAAAADHRFVFAQFPAVDGYTHQSTPDGPKVLRALEEVDRTVEQLCEILAARDELDDALIVLVSDHGAASVHTHLDLAEWFRGRGVPTLSHPIVWTARPQVAVMVAGNGSAMLYAQPDRPRARRWPLARLRQPNALGLERDVVADLLAEPAVAFVAAEEGDGSVRVAAADGEALIRREGDRISYQVESGDPLELGGSVAGDESDWPDIGWDSAWPDAPYHLLDQFRAGRTGDLVVIAREGYDFRERFEIPEHKAGHGSLGRSHMMTPAWSNRPGLPQRIRTVDLFPALLDWLGEPVPEGLDGRPVWLPGSDPGGDLAEVAESAS